MAVTYKQPNLVYVNITTSSGSCLYFHESTSIGTLKVHDSKSSFVSVQASESTKLDNHSSQV